MSNLRRLALVVAALLMGTTGLAGPTAPGSVAAEAASPKRSSAGSAMVVRTAAHSDLSPPLRDLRPAPPSATRERMKAEFFRPLRPYRSKPGLHAPDPVLQRRSSRSSGPNLPAPTVSFEGLDAATANPEFLLILPPDPVGEAGPNHYVQMVNSAYAVYSKTGTKLLGPIQINAIWAGFGGPCQTNNDGDPIVVYDQLADRWLLSQFTASAPYYECVAISQTPNPMGAFFRYAFLMDNTTFWDYPKFGVWPDAYYMSANLFANGSTFDGAGAVAFERDRMLAGNPAARMVQFTRPSPFGGQLPSDLDGSTLPPAGSPNYFMEADDDAFGFPTDRINVFEFHVDWVTTANSTFTGPVAIDTAPFDSEMCVGQDPSRNCIPQLGSPFRLDAISDRLMNRLAYRNFGTHEAIVANHTVDIDGTDHGGLRWYELRKPPSPVTNWAIHQQGTYAGDTPLTDVDHRWMASAAMDQSGGHRHRILHLERGQVPVPGLRWAQARRPERNAAPGGDHADRRDRLAAVPAGAVGRLLGDDGGSRRRLHVLVHRRVLHGRGQPQHAVAMAHPGRLVQVPELRGSPRRSRPLGEQDRLARSGDRGAEPLLPHHRDQQRAGPGRLCDADRPSSGQHLPGLGEPRLPDVHRRHHHHLQPGFPGRRGQLGGRHRRHDRSDRDHHEHGHGVVFDHRPEPGEQLGVGRNHGEPGPGRDLRAGHRHGCAADRG